MSCKLREDLPHRGANWSRDDIALFNEHRAKYKEGVQLAKSFYGDRAFIAGEESATVEGCMKLLTMMMNQGDSIAQLLMKCDTKDNKIALTRSYDVITAFYVPEDIKWLKVDSNGSILGEFHGKYIEVDLDEVLRQSWTVPSSEDSSHLEYILWVSRQGKIGFVHNQEEIIDIDGVRYNRLIFMQPMIPVAQCLFVNMTITTSGPCTVNCRRNLIQLVRMN